MKVTVTHHLKVSVNIVMLFVCVRLLVERVLQDTTEDLRVQCSTVDQAFSQRCTELIEAKTQLEIRLAEVTDRHTPRNIGGNSNHTGFPQLVPVGEPFLGLG